MPYLIFDFDGVLVSSEPWHKTAYQRVLQKCGHKLTDGTYYDHWTRQGKKIADYIEAQGLDLDPVQIRREKKKLFHKLVASNNILVPGVLEVLAALNPKYPMALATGSYMDSASIVLEHYGLSDFFSVKIFVDDVKNSKPDPETFLLAARRLNVPVGSESECVVIEDSEKGSTAADEAGMKCLVIPNEVTMNDNFGRAKRLSDIRELTVDLIESLYM